MQIASYQLDFDHGPATASAIPPSEAVSSMILAMFRE